MPWRLRNLCSQRCKPIDNKNPTLLWDGLRHKAKARTRGPVKRLIYLLLLLLPGLGQAQEWAVYTHSMDKQSVLIDGQLRGREHAGKRAFYLELVHLLLADMGTPLPIREVPLARGLALLKAHSDVVLFNLSQTPERKALAHWIGPTLAETDYLYESRQRPTGIRTLLDAQNLPVCVLNGSNHDEQLARAGFTHISRNNSYSNCLRMLAAGRVALIASGDIGMAQRLRETHLQARDVQPTAVSLGSDDGYIALSHDMPAQQVAQWRTALLRVQRDGRFQQLYERYAQ